MALIRCPDCGRDVSTEAPACPGCGRPMKSEAHLIAASAPVVAAVVEPTPDPNAEPPLGESEEEPVRATVAATAGPSGVRGWLFFLCVSLMLLSPILFLTTIEKNYASTRPLFGRYPRLQVISISTLGMAGMLAAFGMFVGYRLSQRHPDADYLARHFFLVCIGMDFVAAALPLTAGFPAKDNAELAPGLALLAVKSAIPQVLWYLYLVRSKRVRNTFHASAV
jgi:hypothetical protein